MHLQLSMVSIMIKVFGMGKIRGRSKKAMFTSTRFRVEDTCQDPYLLTLSCQFLDRYSQTREWVVCSIQIISLELKMELEITGQKVIWAMVQRLSTMYSIKLESRPSFVRVFQDFKLFIHLEEELDPASALLSLKNWAKIIVITWNSTSRFYQDRQMEEYQM